MIKNKLSEKCGHYVYCMIIMFFMYSFIFARPPASKKGEDALFEARKKHLESIMTTYPDKLDWNVSEFYCALRKHAYHSSVSEHFSALTKDKTATSKDDPIIQIMELLKAFPVGISAKKVRVTKPFKGNWTQIRVEDLDPKVIPILPGRPAFAIIVSDGKAESAKAAKPWILSFRLSREQDEQFSPNKHLAFKFLRGELSDALTTISEICVFPPPRYAKENKSVFKEAGAYSRKVAAPLLAMRNKVVEGVLTEKAAIKNLLKKYDIKHESDRNREAARGQVN